MRAAGSRRLIGAGLLVATATLLTEAPVAVAVGGAPAVAAPGGAQPVPPRISALIPADQGCVKPSTGSVTLSSAAQKILKPSLAWQLSEGAGVRVAVLDTGVAGSGSGQLAGQVTLGPDEVPGRATGQDCVGHGTFVAGLIAARPQPGTTVVGIAPQAHVYAIGVTDSHGGTTPDLLAKGIDDAVRAGVRIIDVSVVSPASSAALERAVSAAAAKGALVIAPAAADDQQLTGPVYPAALPGVLAVANSVLQPGAGTTSAAGPAPATGPAQLQAPGNAVLSVGPGGGAFIGSGAAYSAAYVAGTAALVDAYHPGLTLAQRRDRLIATGYPSTSFATSAAVIDPYAAVATILPGEYRSRTAVAPRRAVLTGVPAATSSRALRIGWLVAAAGVAAVFLAFGAVATIRQGRQRHWRPGVNVVEPDQSSLHRS